MSNKYIAIHGHFYQPPRENPWLGTIERQDSAYPFKDWNQRINRECYHPNAYARILDHYGRIEDLVLNYKYINFNIGPTLMDWIEKYDFELYKRIIYADQLSQDMFNGHGNAIAQVYNHVIMPLADKQDRITQIEWGIAHFEKHFRRYPEAIWLAETAVNYDVLRDLVDYGMKYVVLAPNQVEKIRSFCSQNWHDVSTGKIDTSKPYRIYTHYENDEYIDVFFYNKQLSTGISFLHYLRDSHRLADEFQKHMHGHGNKIITACTDGESYGHHEHYGEMCLAYFLDRLCDERGFKIANFAHYLEMHPPQDEAVLKSGENGEGTAWSCAHGVSRWKKDCGCKTGGGSHWNQKWRSHLRDAFDYLSDTITPIYDRKLSPYFEDVWEVRNNYIEVILDYSEKTRDNFLKKYCKKKKLSKEDKQLIFSLLETQKNLLLMYTSCAWFFSDISGIETVQNMKYALLAIQYVSPYTKIHLLENFLKILQKAKSNLKSPSTGRQIFNKYVKPSIVKPQGICANYIISSFLKNDFSNISQKSKKFIFDFSIHINSKEEFYDKDKKLIYGNLEAKNNINAQEYSFKYYLFCDGLKDLKCFVVKKCNNNKLLEQKTMKKKQEYLMHVSSKKVYTLSDLKLDNRDELIFMAMKTNLKQIEKKVFSLYENNKDLIEIFTKNNVHFPQMIIDICSHYITRAITKKIDNWDIQGLKDMIGSVSFIKMQRMHINEEKVANKMGDVIFKELEELEKEPKTKICENIIELMQIKDDLGIEIPIYYLQEKLFFMIDKKEFLSKPRFYKKFCDMVGYFNIAVD